jgi:hypothetical protein
LRILRHHLLARIRTRPEPHENHLGSKTTKTVEVKSLDIIHDEQLKEKHAAIQVLAVRDQN